MQSDISAYIFHYFVYYSEFHGHQFSNFVTHQTIFFCPASNRF